MLVEHDILSVPGNKYKLREDLSSDYNIEETEVDLFENTAIEIIYEKFVMKNQYTLEKFKILIKQIVSLIIYNTTISAKISDENEANSYDSDTLKRVIIDAIHNVVSTDEGTWFNITEYILLSDRQEIVYWLNSTRKTYWFLAIMGLDPELARLYRDNLHDYKLFLDSHIVIRCIVNAGDEAQICRDIILKGKENSVKMYLSRPIFEEVENSFFNAVKMYRNCDGDIGRITQLLKNLDKKSDILDGFLLQKNKDKQLEWEEYISSFYSKRDETILSEYIKNTLGIEIIDDCEFCEEEWGEIQELYSDLLDKRVGNLRKRKAISGDDKGEDIRQMNLRTNEAKQLEIIYQYKQKGENDYWFVTYDSFIYRVCSDIYKKNSYSPKYYPCYLKPNKWLEILTICGKNDIGLNAFREILMSQSLHIAVNSIEGKVINEILEKNLDQQVKDKNFLKKMFMEAVNKTIIEDIETDISNKKTDKNNDDPEMEDFIKRVLYERMQRYETILFAQDKELVKMKKEKDKALHKADYYKKELKKAITGRNNRKRR
jgi:hypothetical protein